MKQCITPPPVLPEASVPMSQPIYKQVTSSISNHSNKSFFLPFFTYKNTERKDNQNYIGNLIVSAPSEHQVKFNGLYCCVELEDVDL